MADSPHRAKYERQLILGFVLLLAFTGMTFFTIFEVQRIGTWYFLAGVAGILLCGAAYFISSATVHKVKSDISKKVRKKEMHETFMQDQ
jgi:hypothetical protein